MGKSESKDGDKDIRMDIEKAFQDKKSNDFYKYYKVLINTWKQLRDFYYDTFPEKELPNGCSEAIRLFVIRNVQ